MCSSVALSTFTVFCNHPHHRSPELCSPPKLTLHPHSTPTPHSLPRPSVTTIRFCLYDLDSECFIDWNHMLCYVWLLSLKVMSSRFILAVEWSECPSFLRLSNAPLHRDHILLPIRPPMDTGYFLLLGCVTNTDPSISVQAFFQALLNSLGCIMPRSRIAGHAALLCWTF